MSTKSFNRHEKVEVSLVDPFSAQNPSTGSAVISSDYGPSAWQVIGKPNPDPEIKDKKNHETISFIFFKNNSCFTCSLLYSASSVVACSFRSRSFCTIAFLSTGSNPLRTSPFHNKSDTPTSWKSSQMAITQPSPPTSYTCTAKDSGATSLGGQSCFFRQRRKHPKIIRLIGCVFFRNNLQSAHLQ